MAALRPLALLLPLLLVLPATAAAKVSGQCTYKDKAYVLVDGAAWVVPPDEDDDDDDEAADDEDYGDEPPPPPPTPERLLAFTTFVIDAGALARAEDREDALREQNWEHDDSARLQLTLSPDDGVITQQYVWISPGTNLSIGSNEVGKLALAKAAAGRVAASYNYTDDDAEGPICTLSFDLALLGDAKDAPPPPGVPLPAGGGEPGAAYLALNAALRAGNLDALAKLLPPDRAAELATARKSPDFAEQLAFMQALTPDKVKISGGRRDGDRAWLEFTATEGGQPRAGTAELKFEGGRWVMVKESTRDPD